MISKHVSDKESVYSATALRLGIENTPTKSDLVNMQIIAETVFEPLRKWVGGAIKINSFFRSVALNIAIGGSSKSQHCQGCAIDLDDTFGFKSNAQMFDYIKNNLDFDQLIWEYGSEKNPDWVHVSYVSAQKNRKKVMQAYILNRKTAYKLI